MPENGRLVLDVITALEERRLDDLRTKYHPQISFHWPPGFSYSGDHRGADVAAMSERFAEVWAPLQPDDDTRRMDARVVAEDGDVVVVDYTWRARDKNGNTLETPVLAKYEVRDGKLADARMFYYDLPRVLAFVEHAQR